MAEENMAPTNQKTESKDPSSLKRAAETDKGNSSEIDQSGVDSGAECKRSKIEVSVDLAENLGLKVGDRLEMQWDITTDDNKEISHWWGATLLEHDGRTEEGVAIRTLYYDPFPEGGFDESSKEDVVFMGKDTLINHPTQDELSFRKITDDDSAVVWVNDSDLEEMVNGIISKAMAKASTSFNALPRSAQAAFAEKIASKKAKLVELLQRHMQDANGRVVTAQDAQSLLAQTMTDD